MECNPQALIYYPRSTKVKNGRVALQKKPIIPARDNPLHGLSTAPAAGPSSSVPQTQWNTRKAHILHNFSMILFYFNLILSLNITK